MNPLKKFQPDWKLAPLSVLIDPKRLLEVIGGVVDPDALYIMELQMAESDRILISKSDLLSDTEKQNANAMIEKKFPGKKVGFISSKTGEGFDAWLSEIMSATDAGTTIVPVDYDRYAHGEAVLGWLNATASVTANTDGKKLLTDFLTAFHSEIKKSNSEVGHVKASLNVNGKEWVGNLTALNGNVDIRDTEAKSGGAMMTINARVQASPEAVEKLVRELCAAQSITVDSLRCLMPGRPTPTHRFS